MTIHRQPPAPPDASDLSASDAVQFGCFLLHTQHRLGEDRNLLRLTLEDLASGDKATFESIGALVRYLDAWPRVEERWARPPLHTIDSPSPERG
jgi:hypothetical protein